MSTYVLTFTADQRRRLAAWADLLETTNQPQTTNHLHTDAGFCCLGLYLDNLPTGAYWYIDDDEPFYRHEPTGTHANLPYQESQRLGTEQACFWREGTLHSLTLHELVQQMNDEYGWDFTRIAQEIRHWLEYERISDAVHALTMQFYA